MCGEELKWSCPFCGHKLRAGREHAGKQTKCPRCRKVLRIPLHDLAVDELIEKLTKAREATTRAAAAGELSRSGLKADRAVAYLVRAGQRDRSALVRFRSLEAVARILDGQNRPGQIPARIITETINAVRLNHDDAGNDIQEFGSNPTTSIRRKAQQVLIRIGTAAERFLADAIRQSSADEEVQEILADALQTIREHQDD